MDSHLYNYGSYGHSHIPTSKERNIFMKIQLYRVTLYSIIVYLTIAVLSPSLAVPSQQDDGEPHFCGVGDLSPDGHPSNQFPNRRYARTLANLDVGEPRTVRLIYFLPTDWPYRAEAVQKMKDIIRSVQTFYAEQMEAHGYGKLTFNIESDPEGEPLVHRVDGKHPFSHYDNSLGSVVVLELQEAFDFWANIYFIVLGTDALRHGDGRPTGGVGSGRGNSGGYLLVPDEFSRPDEISMQVVAHELGHSFGLGHDFRDGAYIMSYGPGNNQLSVCAAGFLSREPYFNPDIPIDAGDSPGSIEIVSQRRYPSGSRSIPVRLQVSDPEGVHQVLLFAQGGLQACHRLDGDNNAIVDFLYDGGFGREGFTSLSESMGQTIVVVAVDMWGNGDFPLFSNCRSVTAPHSHA